MINTKHIPIAEPALIGNEKKYVLDCVDSGWISSAGKYVKMFEDMFSQFCGVDYAVSCCNGTAALRLILLALGIGSGDEVIVPSFTFVATANAVLSCGAKPIFVDSDITTWNIDPSLVEKLITPNTKAIIPVHIFGCPVDMDPILAIAKKYDLFVIEDAAEAHGAEYKGRKVGSFGVASMFSFYGNKIITTGEGGMIVTNDLELSKKIRQLSSHGMSPTDRYWFPVVGYNYRMTNIAAAIGLAQLEKIDWHLERRKLVNAKYVSILSNDDRIVLQHQPEWACSSFWMNSVLIKDTSKISRDDVMSRLLEAGIETRPLFYPMHTLPIYKSDLNGELGVSERIAFNGLSLPSFATLDYETIEYICDKFLQILGDV